MADIHDLHDVAQGNATLDTSSVHVRVQGRSYDLPMVHIGVTRSSTDAEVREAVARHLDVPIETFNNTVLERLQSGNMTLRPEAVFG